MRAYRARVACSVMLQEQQLVSIGQPRGGSIAISARSARQNYAARGAGLWNERSRGAFSREAVATSAAGPRGCGRPQAPPLTPRPGPWPSCPQPDRAVEDEPVGAGIGVEAEIALALELHGVADGGHGQRRLDPARQRFERMRIEIGKEIAAGEIGR